MCDGAASPPLLRLYRHRAGSRIHWSEVRMRIDLTKVAAALLGPPVERRGLTSGSLGWYCPFHREASPSFRVVLGEAIWSCSTCGAGGDAAALVMRLKSIGFRDAVGWLDEQDGLDLSHDLAPDAYSLPGRSRCGIVAGLLRCRGIRGDQGIRLRRLARAAAGVSLGSFGRRPLVQPPSKSPPPSREHWPSVSWRSPPAPPTASASSR